MISVVLAAIILFCIGFSLCTHAKESGDYLIFGDSITTGYGLADKTMRFATLVSNKLGIAERNYGVDGATSADLLTKINGSEETKRNIAGAEFISVSIGGNDLLDKYKYSRRRSGWMLLITLPKSTLHIRLSIKISARYLRLSVSKITIARCIYKRSIIPTATSP